jgi:hypothetical protein
MKRALEGHDVKTVADLKWEGIKNGRLLALAATEFDVFLTVDKNLQFQQNLHTIPLPIIVVNSRFLRWHDLLPFVPTILKHLDSPLERKVYVVNQ